MVLVFTANANNSDEIKKELVLAGRHRVTIVPVRVEDVIPNDAFTYEFATRQWIDLFKNWEEEIERLAEQIGHVLSASPAAPDAADGPPRRRFVKPKQWRPALLWGAVLAAIVIASGSAGFYASTRTRPPTPVKAVAAAPFPSPASPGAQTSSATDGLSAVTATAPPPVQSPPPAAAAAAAPPPPSPPASSMGAAAPATSPPPPASEPPPPRTIASAGPSTATPSAAVPPPESVSAATAAAADPDEAAWQKASGLDSRVAYADYVKAFGAGAHLQDAELRIADLILNGAGTGKNFDGAWQTTWTCTNVGEHPGYSFRFSGQVKDGVYHGLKGVKGQPSSMELDGKIEVDGAAAFFGEIIVGSSVVALGAPRGTPSDFHALAHFDGKGGAGKRIEGRACTLAFEKL
jgi:hypothetical protein